MLYGDFLTSDEDITGPVQNRPTFSESIHGEMPSEDITSQYQYQAQTGSTAAQQGLTQGSITSSGTSSQRSPSTLVRRKSFDRPVTGGKWFELCVNYGLERKRLGEVSLARVENDAQLFTEIKAKYESIRADRIKDLYLITPVDIEYVQVTLLSGKTLVDLLLM